MYVGQCCVANLSLIIGGFRGGAEGPPFFFYH